MPGWAGRYSNTEQACPTIVLDNFNYSVELSAVTNDPAPKVLFAVKLVQRLGEKNPPCITHMTSLPRIYQKPMQGIGNSMKGRYCEGCLINTICLVARPWKSYDEKSEQRHLARLDANLTESYRLIGNSNLRMLLFGDKKGEFLASV